MLRDVFYYGKKPNVHPKEQYATDLKDARKKSTTEHFWVINEHCDYTDFDWDFDFEFLPDHDVWAMEHNNVWPSFHQKDSGTWLCPKRYSDVIVYRADVDKLKRKNIITSNWKILENIDKSSWDFSWHPDPTDPPYIYKWGSKYAPVELKSCLEYHVEGATNIKYMNTIVELLPNYDCLIEHYTIDKSHWDFSWRPDPLDPPFIYIWGNKHVSGKVSPTLEYHAPGATEKKHLPELVPLLPQPHKFAHLEDAYGIDYSWIPDPTAPPYIYAWGNQWNKPEDKISIQYVVEGATEYKYMEERAVRRPCLDNWEIPQDIDVTNFDFSWEPSPASPPYIYQFGTQWQKTGGPRYIVPGATEIKYIDILKAKALSTTKNWTIPDNLDITGFDFSWHPDDTSPPYIYHFATQWALTGGPIYTVEGATEIKYLEEPSAIALPSKANWEIPDDIDVDSFDFSWHPYVEDQPYVYIFGTQHQKTGGPKYLTPGVIPTSPVKYIDRRILQAKRISNKNNFAVLNNYKIKNFDYSWHPDDTEEPYIYVFGNNQYSAEIMPTIEYAMPGAKQIKYVSDVVATLDVDMSNWEVPTDVDTTGFDFSWKPNPKDPAYIYEFGTQHQKNGGPRYVVPGATETKYVDTMRVNKLADKSKFSILDNLIIDEFDYSWHPDSTEEPYIYVFGNNFYPGTLMPTIEYVTPGAEKIKYVHSISAKLGIDKTNWEVPDNVDISLIDFTWKPNPKDPPYIYQYGTQHQKTGGPRYVVPGATEVKYVDIKITALPKKENFAILDNLVIEDFDYSWHPDDTDQPYIYLFGNNQYPAEIMPTIEYRVAGATQVKYVNGVVAKLGTDMKNWEVPGNVDTTGFDFSWKPNPKDPAYVYEFSTQWQKTGGPRYVVPDATEVKYVPIQKVKALPTTKNWTIPSHVDVTNFDFSWHPDNTSPPYIYHFATQWALTGGPIYTCEGATEVKYLEEPSAVALPNKENWEIPEDIDVESFDFSWHPYVEDQPYVYVFGTQHQKTGGPKYVTPGAIPTSPVKYIDTRILKSKKLSNKNNFAILNNYKIKDFDWSWHPDETEEPYIYVFGNNQYPAEIMPTIEYAVPGAKQIKYVNDIIATLDVDMGNWEIPKDIDTNGFDFSWKPNPKDPAYIYEFGTQWQKTGGPRYVVPDAIEVKYIETQKVKALSTTSNWTIPPHVDVSNFDFSWHPDNTSPPYIYHFATQWALTGGPIYTCNGATEVKYLEEPNAVALPNKENWEIPDDVDADDFDFSWHPYIEDQPYIYQFGTQHQKTGGHRYITPGVIPTSPVKYIDTRILKSKRKENKSNFAVLNNYKIKNFDWSWHPDDTEQPYVYVFGNNQYPAEIMPTIEYTVPGAKEVKYVPDIVATLDEDKTNWIISQPIDENKFDFSWKPNPKDPPYIYRWGNKYISNKYKPTIEYIVPGATDIKYMDDNVDVLPEWDRWEIPDNLDIQGFDFNWRPDPLEPDLIWQFGTQWQKTGGPRYVTPGATEIKYIDFQKVKILSNRESSNWELPSNIDVTDFDFSWHPDDTSPPYIYHFATQWALSGGPIYRVAGATEVKYLDEPCAVALPNKENWEIPDDVDVSSFDFSWHPYVEDQPYIYQFGTQWQKTGGPRYMTPGVIPTSPVKYIDTRIIKGRKLPNRSNFSVLNNYKIKDFDWSWHPDDTEEPYIYVFGNTQYPAEIMPTVEYIVPGATKIKYVHDVVATLDQDRTNWDIPERIDVSEFDFSWKPNPKDPAYIYEFGTQWQKTGGPRYVVAGANEVKYIEGSKARSLPNKRNWILPKDLNIEDFDYSWHPDSTEGAYIYVFPTQWQLTAGPRYFIEGATEFKYMEEPCAKVGHNMKNWEIPNGVVIKEFDYSWHPHPDDPTFIYEFATQWHDRGGPRYVAPGSNKDTPVKYIDGRIIKATLGQNTNNWKIYVNIDQDKFDFSWVPHPNDPPYIYRWGNKYVSGVYKPTIEYVVPAATEYKYMTDDVAVLPEWDRWHIPDNVSHNDFDFSWRPDPLEPNLIWQFGTQWQKTGGPKYTSPGATEVKYIDIMKVKRLPSKGNWFNPQKADVTTFDYSWHPDDTSPPYIYQFGTLLDKNDGPRYITPNSQGEIIYLPRVETEEVFEEIIETVETSIMNSISDIVVNKYYLETTLEDLVNQHPNELFWALNKNINYNNFNFDWRPESIRDMEYVQVFGSPDSEATQTYLVNANYYLAGQRDFKFIEDIKLNDEYLSRLFVKPDMFFVDRGNKEAQARFEWLKEKYGNVQKTRYLNSWVDTINRCINRSSTNLCWILNSELDYSNFNFNYYPNPWQMKMVHVFGTQWNHWGTTFMVNRETFANDTKYIKIIEHLSNLNFVKDRVAIASNVVHDIIYIDHGNLSEQEIQNISNDGKLVIDYEVDYLTTFKKILSKLPEKKEHYIWIVSTICDYKNFDFTYICDPFSREQLHVFPSDRQKFGDTFFVNVNKLRELIANMESLKDYEKINYNQAQRTKRLEAPTIVTNFDSHVISVMEEFNFPYATFITSDNQDISYLDDEPMSLWDQESKNILVTSTGGTRIIVPKEAKQYVETQLYDYPYIKTASRLAKSKPMDIVFLSNGEKCAEENYEHLLKVTKGLPNRIVRVDGVNGRVQAYHAAAEASNTAWMFTVFAKLKVNAKFDFNWQPDRLQIPKHYMFLAKNPVNGLIYGHQGMIAYNKQMTLDNDGHGLDFTLDSPHETIELLSGIATYNVDEFSTWRTAFREVIKLKKDGSDISLKRLEAWLTKAEGDFAEYSLKGAKDGVAYFDKVKGKNDKLRLSYEWDWLRKRFNKKDKT